LLLATDLGPRSDRALDRAGQLATAWRAQLTVVHALEQAPEFLGSPGRKGRFWRVGEDRVSAVARQLRADMMDDGVAASVVVEDGDPADLVLETARRTGTELIVTGLARAEPFGRLFPGTTVERLVRRADAPVLMVRNRVRGAYRRIFVGTDFSPACAGALMVAACWFPDAQITLFHAAEPPLAGLASRDEPAVEWMRVARTEAEGFLASAAIPVARRPSVAIVIEQGRPESVLRDYAEQDDFDLVVVGRRGRNPVADLLLGSTADAIMHQVPSDVMVVRD
jgi:nucleotide-binding universal stress UspA family protein